MLIWLEERLQNEKQQEQSKRKQSTFSERACRRWWQSMWAPGSVLIGSTAHVTANAPVANIFVLHIYVYINTYALVSACMCVCSMCVCENFRLMRICTCMCLCVCKHACTFVCVSVPITRETERSTDGMGMSCRTKKSHEPARQKEPR